MKIKTFVINLPESVQRREWMEIQLKQFPELDVEFIEATNGKNISDENLIYIYDKNAAILEMKRELTRGEIGIADSQLRIYKEIVKSNIPFAIILEDDVLLSSFFIDILYKLIKFIKEDTPQIVLFTPVPNYSLDGSIVLSQVKDFRLSILKNDAYYAAGYILNKKASEVLINQLSPIKKVADSWGTLIENKTVEFKAVTPNIIGFSRYAYNNSIIDSDSLRKEGLLGLNLKKQNILKRLNSKIKNNFRNLINRNVKNNSNVWYNNEGIVFPKF
jgi:glycosyl transferase family 25